MGPTAGRLLAWYRANARDLPWRRTREPYPVWVSEVMLQQTRVATVLPRWERWMRRFPTVESLSRASEEEVAEEWAGLGYYARARALHSGAVRVVREGWPKDASGWGALPGVGEYTAGAMASIALGQDEPAVDGNVVRVYSRLHADDAGSTLTRARAWSRSEMPPGLAHEWNQALMELGATVCTPRSPRCAECPLSGLCRARAAGRQAHYPPKPPRPPAVEVQLFVGAFWCQGRFAVRKVPPGPWWRGLRELPTERSLESLESLTAGAALRPLGEFVHTVTRHRLSVTVLEAKLPRPFPAFEWRQPGEEVGLSAPSSKALRLLGTHRGQEVHSEDVGDLECDDVEADEVGDAQYA